MTVSGYRRLLLSTAFWSVTLTWWEFRASFALPSSQTASSPQSLRAVSNSVGKCPRPAVLSQLTRHTVASNETVEGLARRYDLIPATLLGMNPVLRQGGSVPVGTQIVIPPYNGILVKIPSGQTLRDVATTYRVRSDVLFEINGCPASPKVVFVPGVNWSPITPSQDDRRNQTSTGQPASFINRYPLPLVVPITSGYGWRVHPVTGQVAFHSGVDLEVSAGTPVMAVASGTVAFAGSQGDYGNLVVLNHSEGYQTRYAQLTAIAVSVGQVIKQGTTLGTVGSTGLADRPHLHFEIRSNSTMGWVAQDPTPYLRDMKVVRQPAKP